MRTGSFLNIRLLLLLLLIAASYRCHPQTSLCFTERYYHGSCLWDSASESPGCPSPARSDATSWTEPTLPCQRWRGPPRPAGTGCRAGTPISGSPSNCSRLQPEQCPLLWQQPQGQQKVRRSGCRSARNLHCTFSLFCVENLSAF